MSQPPPPASSQGGMAGSPAPHSNTSLVKADSKKMLHNHPYAINAMDDDSGARFSVGLIHPFTLVFSNTPDPTLEWRFQEYYHSKYTSATRKAVLFASILWILLIIIDIDKYSVRSNPKFSITVRVITGAFGLLYWGSSFHPKGRAYIQLTTMLAIVGFGTSQVVLGILDDTVYEWALQPVWSISLLLIGSTSSTFFLLRFFYATLVNVLGFVIFAGLVGYFHAYNDLTGEFILVLVLLVGGNLFFSMHAFSREYYIRRGFLAAKQLQHEEAKSHALLAKMLPQSIIMRLKQAEGLVYVKHPSISVLFSHIHDFDEHTANLSARDVIALLNTVFSKFDQITDVYPVYKVETIGDVYLISAGCPEEREDHVAVISRVALDMMASMPECQVPGHHPIELRVGINSGPVIAGVVGLRYPRYRLMGDTVNTSSRMSTTCGAGEIQVSSKSIEELAKFPGFESSYRGEIPVKGKGIMKTYLLKSYAAPPGTEPVGGVPTDWMKSGINLNYLPKPSPRPRGDSEAAEDPDHQRDSIADAAIPGGDDEEDIDAQIREKVKRVLKTGASEVQPNSTGSGEKKEVTQVSATETTPPPGGGQGSATSLQQSQSGLILRLPSTEKSGLTVEGAATARAPTENLKGDKDTLKNMTGKAVANSKSGAVPPMKQLQHDARWRRAINMAFIKDPEVEHKFQQSYLEKFMGVNKRWMFGLCILLCILSVYDTLSGLTVDFWIPDTAYALRALGWVSALSNWCLLHFKPQMFSARPRLMQWTSLFVVSIMGCLSMIQVHIFYQTFAQDYGLAVLLLLLSCVAFFIGLQFHFVLASHVILVLYFVISGWAYTGDFPYLVGLPFISGVLFINSSYSVEFYIRQDFVRLLRQQNEERRTREFLAGMLPAFVLDEIRKVAQSPSPGDGRQMFIAHERDSASVLFSDIVSFTTLASRLKPEEVVALLNVMFSEFDRLSALHDVYKVETIGDAYLACSGVVNDAERHSVHLVDCGLAMQVATSQIFAPDDGSAINIRIGIHTGYVIAGVVGRKMPRYHLFGETVTTAEEVEAKGIPKHVCVTGATWAILYDAFNAVEVAPLHHEGKEHKRYKILSHKDDDTWPYPYRAPPVPAATKTGNEVPGVQSVQSATGIQVLVHQPDGAPSDKDGKPAPPSPQNGPTVTVHVQSPGGHVTTTNGTVVSSPTQSAASSPALVPESGGNSLSPTPLGAHALPTHRAAINVAAPAPPPAAVSVN